jgi:aspartate racemase
MKTIGIIGGIGPESTIEYYRQIIALYREQKRDGSYPPIIINSVDMKRMLDLIEAQESAGLTEYLVGEVERLANSGADLGLLASNTPHIVFEDIQRQSPIPLISIVRAACDATKALGITKVGLLGTRFTMQGTFYTRVFAEQGITLVVPGREEQERIHNKYMIELVKGIFLAETRERLLTIVDELKEQQDIQALILGGTEPPLILRDESYKGIPFLDTTKIHVEHAVARMLS